MGDFNLEVSLTDNIKDILIINCEVIVGIQSVLFHKDTFYSRRCGYADIHIIIKQNCNKSADNYF